MALNQSDEFVPLSALGPEAFSAIQTLPTSIGMLKQVTKCNSMVVACNTSLRRLVNVQCLPFSIPILPMTFIGFPMRSLDAPP